MSLTCNAPTSLAVHTSSEVAVSTHTDVPWTSPAELLRRQMHERVAAAAASVVPPKPNRLDTRLLMSESSPAVDAETAAQAKPTG